MPCKQCENGKYKFGNTGECKYDTLTECQEDNKDYYEKTTSIVELVIDDESESLAIDAISLVSAPAIEQDFVYFGKEKNNLTFAKVKLFFSLLKNTNCSSIAGADTKLIASIASS